MKQFTELAESGYYDNTYVFSVEDGVYFEAGSPNPDGSLNSADGDTYERVERETSGDLWPFRGAFCVPTTAQEAICGTASPENDHLLRDTLCGLQFHRV